MKQLRCKSLRDVYKRQLTYRRNNRNLHVYGYQEEGTITTPFDMRVQNEIDRFNLVKNAIRFLPQLGNRGSYLVQQMNDKLVEHKQYIHEDVYQRQDLRRLTASRLRVPSELIRFLLQWRSRSTLSY